MGQTVSGFVIIPRLIPAAIYLTFFKSVTEVAVCRPVIRISRFEFQAASHGSVGDALVIDNSVVANASGEDDEVFLDDAVEEKWVKMGPSD